MRLAGNQGGGETSTTGNNDSFTFPIAFTRDAICVYVSGRGTSNGKPTRCSTQTLSKSAFSVWAENGGTGQLAAGVLFYWLAFGY